MIYEGEYVGKVPHRDNIYLLYIKLPNCNAYHPIRISKGPHIPPKSTDEYNVWGYKVITPAKVPIIQIHPSADLKECCGHHTPNPWQVAVKKLPSELQS